MLTLVRTLWLAIALAACGETKPSGADWSSRPLETVAGKVGHGSDTFAFTVQLPKGLVADPHLTENITIGYEPTPHDFTAPSVMIGYDPIPAKTLDDALRDTMPGPNDEIVRKDAIDGGYIIVTRANSHKHWKVNVTRRVGDRAIDCMAQQANDNAELGEPTRVLLEKICLSLAPQR
jgi:hypothetical protein